MDENSDPSGPPPDPRPTDPELPATDAAGHHPAPDPPDDTPEPEQPRDQEPGGLPGPDRPLPPSEEQDPAPPMSARAAPPSSLGERAILWLRKLWQWWALRNGRPTGPWPRVAADWTGRVILTLVALSVVTVVGLRWVTPPTSAFMVREGLVRDHPGGIQYDWVPAEDISVELALAVVTSEDQRFPVHHGFDLVEIRKALDESGRQRGASTISQQVAKNLFLWPGGWVRKGLEAYITALIETLWPKRRILEVYLNVAEFGPGVFGAEAASRAFFGKPASDLTRAEAARLAAVLPSPRRMSAARPSEYVRGRQGEIESGMAQLGGPAYLDGIW